MKKSSISVLALSTLLLTGCAGGAAAPASSGAADGATDKGGDLVVGSFGGDYDTFLKDFVDPVFAKVKPKTQVIFSSGDTATLKTKMTAEKSSDAGTFDVVQLSDKDLPEMKAAGTLMKLDPSKIKNWDTIIPSLVDDYCVPHIHSAITIIYNPKKITDKVTNWDQFFTPEVEKQAGAWERWSDYVYYGAAVDAAGGDPGSDLSPGYDTAVDAAKLMKPYGSDSQIKAGLISGEISALIGVRAKPAQWSSESGQTFKSVVPADGTREYISYSCIPANSKNVAAAYEYLNAQLDPSAQESFATHMFYAPTVTSVKLDPAVAKAVGTTKDEDSRIYTADMGAITKAMPEMRRLWSEAAAR